MPKIAVVGLGYVGLPLALGLSQSFEDVIGFDISEEKIEKYRAGIDATREGFEEAIAASSLRFSSNKEDLRACDFFIVGVPTPIDEYKRPDLSALRSACEMVGSVISRGATICFESTVYPGVTEEFCGPILSEVSGLEQGKDFSLAYSPERINPGDKEHQLSDIVKVVSADSADTLKIVEDVYGPVISAGLHSAPSIKVAEAAKVIENTQRDLNIALMNELALIFDRMGISTKAVLDAAGSKWNFLKFTPGLVGGHCIGVDPFYLTSKAEKLGYTPRVILSGRGINDSMGSFIAQKLVKLFIENGQTVKGACVGVLGIAFKENVADTRNSRVPDIISELGEFGVRALVHDPHANPDEVKEEYGIEMAPLTDLRNLDAVVLAVPHEQYLEQGLSWCSALVREGGVIVDVKSTFFESSETLEDGKVYWSL